MLTHDQLELKAEKYANAGLTTSERDDLQALLVSRYVLGFLQGYSVAGGIILAEEKRTISSETNQEAEFKIERDE